MSSKIIVKKNKYKFSKDEKINTALNVHYRSFVGGIITALKIKRECFVSDDIIIKLSKELCFKQCKEYWEKK